MVENFTNIYGYIITPRLWTRLNLNTLNLSIDPSEFLIDRKFEISNRLDYVNVNFEAEQDKGGGGRSGITPE